MDAKKLIKILERTGYKNEDIDYSSPPPIVRDIASKPHKSSAIKGKITPKKDSAYWTKYWKQFVKDISKNKYGQNITIPGKPGAKIPRPEKPTEYKPEVSSEIEDVFGEIDGKYGKDFDKSYYKSDDGVSKEIDDLLAKRRKKLGKPELRKERPHEIKPERESPFADPMDDMMKSRGRKKLF
jgi:hypothetical protein